MTSLSHCTKCSSIRSLSKSRKHFTSNLSLFPKKTFASLKQSSQSLPIITLIQFNSIERKYSQAQSTDKEVSKLTKQLTRITSIEDFAKAQDLLQRGLHAGVEPQHFYYEHLIAKAPGYDVAKHLFFKMVEKHSLPPTGRTVGILARKLLEFGRFQEVFNLYSEYKGQIWVGSPLFMSTQRAIRRMNNTKAANVLWSDFQELTVLHSHKSIWTLFVDLFANLHMFKLAEECLQKMLNPELETEEETENDEMNHHRSETETVAFTTLMSSYLKYDNTNRIFELYREMQKHQVLPLQQTFTVLFSACKKSKDVYLAQQIFQDFISSGLPGNIYILNAYLGVVAAADYRASVKLIEYFEENFDVTPNSRSLTIILTNMSENSKKDKFNTDKKHAKIDESVLSSSRSVFYLIEKHKQLLYKDQQVFFWGLKGAGSHNNTKLLAEMYHRLLADTPLPFTISESIIVTALKYVHVVRNARIAQNIYVAVKDKWGLNYTTTIYNAFLHSILSMAKNWYNMRSAFRFLRKHSPDVKEDTSTLNIRLKAMGKFERYRDMESLFQQRQDEGYLLDEITFNTIILARVKQGDIENALVATKQMLDYGEYLKSLQNQKHNAHTLSESQQKLVSQLASKPHRKPVVPSSQTLDILLNAVRHNPNIGKEIYKQFNTEFGLEPSWSVRKRLEKQIGCSLESLVS